MVRGSFARPLVAASLSVALVASGAAGSASGERGRRPRRSYSFTARALPFTVSRTTGTAGGLSCLDGVRGIHKASRNFRAPRPGVLEARLEGLTGDWDLFLTAGGRVLDASTRQQGPAGASARERVSARLRRGQRVSVVACNSLGEPEVTVRYVFEALPVRVPFRAFSATSYWNTPLPRNAPTDARSGEMIRWLRRDNATDYVALAGARDGEWGNPIYWARPTNRVYDVRNSCDYKRPPEFDSVRIPAGARQDPTSDAAMTVYDKDKGIVYGFYRARYDADKDTWSACGGTVYYLDSNGLEGGLEASDDKRNFGHRGLPPPTYAVRYDEIKKGAIDHVLKIAVNTAGRDHVWPMTGSDGDSSDPLAPPEGARLRLDPDIDLDRLDLTRAQRIIATALQDYGAVIGDQSGSTAVLKLENTVAEGRGQLWDGVLRPDSLEMFSLDDYEFVELGYGG